MGKREKFLFLLTRPRKEKEEYTCNHIQNTNNIILAKSNRK